MFHRLEYLSLRKIDTVICPNTGRFGNEIFSIILAFCLCLEYKIGLIKLPKIPLYYDKDEIFTWIISLEFQSDKTYEFKMNHFWTYNNLKLFKLEKYKEKVKNMLYNTFSFPQNNNFNNNILHIHIRSGDIMLKDKGSGMVQPPCIYYENEIKKHNWDKVIIVSEDTINPCINYLVKKYDNVIYFGKNSLECDIYELLSATNLMCGRGTFIPTLSIFMPHLKKLHYPQDGDVIHSHYLLKTFNGEKCIEHNEYAEYYNEINKLGGWNYNENIKNLMLNFTI